jgi:hypothetical protein
MGSTKQSKEILQGKTGLPASGRADDALPSANSAGSVKRDWIVEMGGEILEFEVGELHEPTNDELAVNHWRERVECLEEWVCELLKKNQTLRMERFADEDEI